MEDNMTQEPLEMDKETLNSTSNNDLITEPKGISNSKTTITNSEINKDEAIVKDVTTQDDTKVNEPINLKNEELKQEKKIETSRITSPSRSTSIVSLSIPSTIKPQLTNININASSSSLSNRNSTENVKELARNLSGMNLLPPIQTTSSPSPSPPVKVVEEEEIEEEWSLKEINWPPLPPLPSSNSMNELGSTSSSKTIKYSEGPVIKVITQNLNGPCSLIALCNILILRYDISIPHSRKSVSYSYLSSLVADYLLKIHTVSLSSPISESAPPIPSFSDTISNDLNVESTQEPNLDLAGVLSILPSTRYGLNLNVQFGSIFGFSSGSNASASSSNTPISPTFPNSTSNSNPSGSTNSTSPELNLFSLCKIPLVHGWLIDPISEKELYETLVLKAVDYDNSLIMLIEGEELSGGISTSSLEYSEDLSEEQLIKEIERRSQWTKREQEKVKDSKIIRNFLTSNSTQLTYTGLISLSTELKASSLSALFRNSHLSVLYRPPSSSSSSSSTTSNSTTHHNSTEPEGPQLFTLVTDLGIVTQYPNIIWESLEDIDGSGTRFWDGQLCECRFVDSSRNRNSESRREVVELSEEGRENNDLLLAQQLQQEEEEEYDRRESRRERDQQLTNQEQERENQNRERTRRDQGVIESERLRNQQQSLEYNRRDNIAEIKRRELEKQQQKERKKEKKEKSCCIS